MTDTEAQDLIATVIKALRRNSFGPVAAKARKALVAAGREAELEAAIALS